MSFETNPPDGFEAAIRASRRSQGSPPHSASERDEDD